MTMPAEPQQGGIFSQKFMGIPALVWLAGAAILAYWWFSRQSSSSSGTGSSSANSGTNTQTTGATTIDTGAVQVSVNTGGSGDTSTQPTPPTPPTMQTTTTVPNVVGRNAPAATKILAAAGLKESGITGGMVASESPKAGTTVDTGSTVKLTGRGTNKG